MLCVRNILEIEWSEKRYDDIKEVALAMTASIAGDDVSGVSLLQCLG